MPTIRSYTAPDGTPRYWFRVDTGRSADGRRIQERQTFTRKKEAEAELARITTERHRGTYVRPTKYDGRRTARRVPEVGDLREGSGDGPVVRGRAALPAQSASAMPARRMSPAATSRTCGTGCSEHGRKVGGTGAPV